MQLTLPETIETTLSPRKAALHLAIGLFVSEEATLGQAAEIAGLTQAAFQKELSARRAWCGWARACSRPRRASW